jgi:hypothetical protein
MKEELEKEYGMHGFIEIDEDKLEDLNNFLDDDYKDMMLDDDFKDITCGDYKL